MSRSSLWSIVVVAALALAAPVSAQQVPTGEAGVAPITSAMRTPAPVISLEPVAAFEAAATTEAPIAPAPALRRSQSVALMIVGGAGMIVGSLIDGDTGTIIMVGGGVVGLIGLFQYLR